MLIFCVAIDYATETITINNTETSKNITTNSTYILPNNADKAITDGKVYVDKSVKVTPTVSLWAKPGVRCGYAYKWYYRTWVNYCPNCKHYNCLLINPKGVPEKELTCARCDSDFDGVVGKEKYAWSHVYLTPA